MICLILLMMLSCQSTNYYEVVGIKNELFTKREGTSINDFINYRTIDRIIDSNIQEQQKEEQEGLSVGRSDRGKTGGENNNKKEVINMEGDFNNLITTITSAMAGIYVAVKTIIAFIKKLKGRK